jgi:hypothetical protein
LKRSIKKGKHNQRVKIKEVLKGKKGWTGYPLQMEGWQERREREGELRNGDSKNGGDS